MSDTEKSILQGIAFLTNFVSQYYLCFRFLPYCLLHIACQIEANRELNRWEEAESAEKLGEMTESNNWGRQLSYFIFRSEMTEFRSLLDLKRMNYLYNIGFHGDTSSMKRGEATLTKKEEDKGMQSTSQSDPVQTRRNSFVSGPWSQSTSATDHGPRQTEPLSQSSFVVFLF